MKYQVFIIILSTSWVQAILGANILAFFPIPSYSHFSGFHPLVLELAKRGHDLTVVSPFRPKDSVPLTYTHVFVPRVKIQSPRDLMEIRSAYRMTNMIDVKFSVLDIVKQTLKLKEMQSFLNSTKYNFDLVLNECWYTDVYLAVGHRYSAPVVCLSPMVPSTTLSTYLGIPNNPSYVPSMWLHHADNMSFSERFYNTVNTAAELLFNIMLEKKEQDMIDSLYVYPGHRDCPSLNELRKNIQLTLVNSHFSVSYSRPYPPNVISVAGMHIMQSSTRLNPDQKLKKLLDAALDGVIYFSFGSNINVSNLAGRNVKVFIDSFRKLSQIVLWKWENGTIDNIPENVYIDKWFPQQFILSHKNCKLFITHGGYHSLVEALHYGLPVIGFPFFTDQFYNMKFTVHNGFGIAMSLDELKENVLDEAIEKTLFDSSFKENARKASSIYLDLPESALHTAVYWVEYAIRNEHDHKSLQNYGLSWYQYFIIDVIIFIFIVLILTLLFFFIVVLYLSKLFRSRKKN